MFWIERRQYGAALRRLITRFAGSLGQPFSLGLMLPAAIPTPRDFAGMRFRSQWVAFMDEIIAARLPAPQAGDGLCGKPRDLFDMLLAARDPETGEAFSRASLRDQMATMIVAGHETTALTLFWSLYLLASSPADQERVAAEVGAIDLGPDAAAEALAKLPYIKAVVSEALRLYPPAFAIARMATGPDRLGDVAVPRGALVMISPWVLHRHRRLWKDPDAFDPARFLTDAPLPHRFAYMPFGAGTALSAAELTPDHRAKLIGSVDAYAPRISEVALKIWAAPELGYQETKTTALLQDELRNAGFAIEAGVAGMPTAFVARAGTSGGPVIAILAEMDALPGMSQDAVPDRAPIANQIAGHACGHHLFGTGAVAAAIAIKSWLESSGTRGQIRVYGTPAEEGGGGKVYMVRAGLFKDVDATLYWHPADANNASQDRNLATTSAKFRFHGQSAHAAAAPDRGRSALDAVEAM